MYMTIHMTINNPKQQKIRKKKTYAGVVIKYFPFACSFQNRK